MSPLHKRLRWLSEVIQSPPLGAEARRYAGYLLRALQAGEVLGMPDSRPMPSIGPRVAELRIRDGSRDWRIIYRIDDDAIVIAEVFQKKSQKTPKRAIDAAQKRLREYDDA